MKLSLRQILAEAAAHNASDLHCLVGNPLPFGSTVH
jgi:Tfp pilus assembly pilus retraction ATPase PilT